MKNKYLFISIGFLLLNIPLFFTNNSFYLIKFILCLISSIFFILFRLSNINILNEECDPKKFFELNKNKSSQSLNNCFAILHMYKPTKKYRSLFMKYYEKAKSKIFTSDTYKMKLEYVLLNFKMLNEDASEEDIVSFENNWLDNEFINKKDKKNINNFLYNKSINSTLESVTNHFNLGNQYYNDGLYEMAKSEFEYVNKYGGTTIYKEIAEQYLKDLIDYKASKNIKKEKISFIQKYLLNKIIIDSTMCLFLLLFIFIITI